MAIGIVPSENQTKVLVVLGIEWVWFTVGAGLIFFSLVQNWDYLLEDIRDGDRDLPGTYAIAAGVLLVTLACNLVLTQGIIKRRYDFVFAWYIIHVIMYVFTAILFCLLVCLIVKFGINYVAPFAVSGVVICYRTYCLVLIVRFMKELQEERNKSKSLSGEAADPSKCFSTSSYI